MALAGGQAEGGHSSATHRSGARPSAAHSPEAAGKSAGYAWYVVGLLTLVYAIHTVDRSIFTILLEPIGREFRLNDAQLGLLAGMSYAIAYCIAAIPIGLLADRTNRRNLLTGLIATWSVLTALAGQAQSFVSLVAIRAGVGLAEAGGQPLSMSIIADYLPQRRRAAAAGIFMSGTGVGALAGLVIGSLVAARYGWRVAFVVVGLPGLLVALLVLLTLREPRRGALAVDGPVVAQGGVPLTETLRFMLSQKGLLLLLGGTVTATLASAAVGVWMPTFLMRVHGFGLAQAGMVTAGVSGFANIAGSFGGAYLIDRIGRRDVAAQPRFASAVLLLAALAVPTAMIAGDPVLAIAALIVWGTSFPAAHGASYGLCTGLVHAPMRGATIALLALLNNLVGYGLGAQISGLVSDALRPVAGIRSLPLTLAVLGFVFYLAAACLFWLSSRRLSGDLARIGD